MTDGSTLKLDPHGAKNQIPLNWMLIQNRTLLGLVVNQILMKLRVKWQDFKKDSKDWEKIII